MPAKKSETAAAAATASAPSAGEPKGGPPEKRFDHLEGVNVTLSMELGQTEMTLDEVTGMTDQSLVELDKSVGDPVDIMINGRPFGRGEVVTVGENFGVRITDIFEKAGGLSDE